MRCGISMRPIDEIQRQIKKFGIQGCRSFSSSPLPPHSNSELTNPSGEEDDFYTSPKYLPQFTNMALSNLLSHMAPVRPIFSRASSTFANAPARPVTAPPLCDDGIEPVDGVLELIDGSAFRGISFGAEGKSVAGECVFQTGMLIDHVRMLVFTRKIRHGGIYRVLNRPLV